MPDCLNRYTIIHGLRLLPFFSSACLSCQFRAAGLRITRLPCTQYWCGSAEAVKLSAVTLSVLQVPQYVQYTGYECGVLTVCMHCVKRDRSTDKIKLQHLASLEEPQKTRELVEPTNIHG